MIIISLETGTLITESNTGNADKENVMLVFSVTNNRSLTGPTAGQYQLKKLLPCYLCMRRDDRFIPKSDLTENDAVHYTKNINQLTL